MSPNDILNTDFTKPVKEQRTQNIKVIGVGGGGNNAVNHMYECGIRDVDFVLINTDRQVLDESPVPTKLTIGPGRGAGGKPERARDYAEKDAEKIAEQVLARGGAAVMTGTLEKDSYSETLFRQGRVSLLRYPVHLNYPQFERLKRENRFARAIPYPSKALSAEREIQF